MFTGIIVGLGKIKNITEKLEQVYITIEYIQNLNLALGNSVAVDGVCLTVTDLKNNLFEVQLMPETLKLTNLGSKKVDSVVNLETSLRVNQGFDGHIVQGHVDGVGKVLLNERQKTNNWILRVEPPQDLFKYIALKGSVTINGVSLTVSEINQLFFEVSLIDFTLENTNLISLVEGSLVNLEADVVARYIERLIAK